MRRRTALVLGAVLLLVALPAAVAALLVVRTGDKVSAPGPSTRLPTVFYPGVARAGSRAGSLGGGRRYVPGQLIVKFADGTSDRRAEQIVEGADASLEGEIAPLDVHVVTAPPDETAEAAAELEDSPRVEYVERDVLVAATATEPNDQLWPTQWGPRLVRAPQAWEVTRGSPSVVIAILDTGVDSSHPDLAGAVVAGFDIVNGDSDPADDEGHGTAAAGVAVARTNNEVGQAGICWVCSVMPVKVLDDKASSTSSAVAAGIVWAADHGARIISMSLGGNATTQTLADAVAYARSKGVVLVASAGNHGSAEVMYPAAYPDVISVAGSMANDSLYDWSARGSWVKVAAPGCNTATARGGGYVNFCGTSSAAPVVAGLVGLVLSAKPQATQAEIEAALRAGAVPVVGSPISFGRVDAEKTLVAGGAAPEPDFGVAVWPSSLSVAPGQRAAFTVSTKPTSGFSGSVALSVTGLPAGAKAAFSPASLTGSGSSQLTISAAPTTPAGSYTVTVQGVAGSATRTTTGLLVVPSKAAAAGFLLSLSPPAATVPFGKAAKAVFTVGVTPLNGFGGPITVSYAVGSGKPARPRKVALQQSDITSVNVVVPVARTARRGTMPVRITVAGGGATKTIAASLTVK